MQASVSDADEAAPQEAREELAPESDAGSGGQEGKALRAAWQCLCPRGDWRTNRERALANKCPAWIQHVADAAPVLLCHLYEIACFMGR